MNPESVKLPLLRDDFLISRSHISICSLEIRRPDAKLTNFTESGDLVSFVLFSFDSPMFLKLQ